MDPGHSMMAAHGAADGARSNGGGRAAPTPGGQLTATEQVVVEPEPEMES